VDFLKIDGSFVKGVLHDPIDREMVRSINEIGHLTGKQTIAAGKEGTVRHFRGAKMGTVPTAALERQPVSLAAHAHQHRDGQHEIDA
jgi:predicted signal transduction protein with EAL and GGDEF domain